MKAFVAAVILSSTITGAVQAQDRSYPKAKVSFEDFKGLVAEVESHRASHLVDLDTFMKMSKEPGTIILDTRSQFRFDHIHLGGAKHLSFTDFTQDNLSKLFPSPDTTILIYCNNNFDGNQKDFATKMMDPALFAKMNDPNYIAKMKDPKFATKEMTPRPKPSNELVNQVAAQQKPIMLALNIPTYINLYGYGYHNVYELDELVKVDDPRIVFQGSSVKASIPAPSLVARVCPLRKEPVFLATLQNVDKNTKELSNPNHPKARIWTSGYKLAKPGERVQFALDYQEFLVSQGETGVKTDFSEARVVPDDARIAFALRWWRTSDKTYEGRQPVDANWVRDALLDADNSIQLTCQTLKAMQARKVAQTK